MERLSWRIATVVRSEPLTRHAKAIAFEVPEWPGHLPGQHIDVRLTAEDGYQAQRSYSLSSAAPGEVVEIGVELIEDGEVSPYLVEEVRDGDQIELRGPIGGYFTWTVDDGGPVLLIAGGSGVVPLMAMLRHRVSEEAAIPMRLLYSARTAGDLMYRAELELIAQDEPTIEFLPTLTRETGSEWQGLRGRIDAQFLREQAWPVDQQPIAFVCGPTPFVESVANGLVELGYDRRRVKTERFGPSGGSFQ